MNTYYVWPVLFKVFGDMLMNKTIPALIEDSFYCRNTDYPMMGLTKKFIQVFCNIIWKNPSKLFGQFNTCSSFECYQILMR